jgi:aldose 1-epimerase
MNPFSYRPSQHPDTDWRTIRLSYADDSGERAEAEVAPEAGSNLVTLRIDGQDYIYSRPTGSPFRGTPMLYPTPNRVRDAQFTFGGRTFCFTPNNGPNFIHGLVRDQPWACDEPRVTAEGASVTTRIAFEPGKAIYELFPIRNTLELTFTFSPRAVRLDFCVQNQDSQPLPFGLAIHPYFPVIGPRENVRLQVPAKRWMEAVNLLPTGRLVDLAEGPADLRQPQRLSALSLDDVFWGLAPDKPQVIYYDGIGKKVTLTASELFTHSVVYTPQGRPYFCIENQSCSTDAHNLHARGLVEEAHLTVLEPGQRLAAWVEIGVSEP